MSSRPAPDPRVWDADVAALVAADPHLAQAVEVHGPPPDWSRPPGFATLVLQVLEQQVSLGAAAAHFRGLEEAAGGCVDPARVVGLDDVTMREAGVSRQKARYVRALARTVLDGRLDLDALVDLPDADVRAQLTAVPGIGPWTADVHLLFVLRRPDVFPAGDRALQVAAAEVLDLDAPPDATTLDGLARRWSPRRSAAARILWHAYLSRRGRTM
jgi:DNA-3-methyladenine glycosylase II